MSGRLTIWLDAASSECFMCSGLGGKCWGDECRLCKDKGKLPPVIHVAEHQAGRMLTLSTGRSEITVTREEFDAAKNQATWVMEPFGSIVGDEHGA